MSFVNIGTDGPPNHTLEVEGDIFVSSVENGTIVPVEIQGNLRLRNKPPTGTDEYRVTDMKLNSTLFGITAPSSDASRSITDFCIDSSGNVGIGVVPTEKLDVSGNLYATGSLTNESNLITATLSSSGNLTCNAIFHGVTSNIYGLLPSNVILMTTLTTTPAGWTDITSQFTDRNVLLAHHDQATLTAAGNNTQSLAAISHNHTVDTHTTSHSHSTKWNNNQLTTGIGGGHTHGLLQGGNNPAWVTTSSGNHAHSKGDIQVVGGDEGVNSFFNQTVNILTQNNTRYLNSGGPSAPNHNHSGGTGYYDWANGIHSHEMSIRWNRSEDNGGNHTHTVSPAGGGSSINLVPPYYTLRFIKKN